MLMTPWVQRLLVANVVAFVLTELSPSLRGQFAFVPAQALFEPWTLLTYAFLHGGFMHLFFNMIMLFFFGPRLEERLGSRTFIRFYLVCAAGGAALSAAMSPFAAVIGASGAIFGVVVGFARYWPRDEIYIWGILPIQARMLAIFLVASSLFAGVAGSQDGIAHFAHLGGLVAGYVFLRLWERGRHRRMAKPPGMAKRPAPTRRSAGEPQVVQHAESLRRWEAIPRERLHEINREEVDSLLEKVGSKGQGALTPEERAFLDRMAESF